MAQKQPLKDKLQGRFTELKALRDEIRLDLHLASMGLRDEWKEIESRIPSRNRTASQLKGSTAKTLDRLAGELRQFQARIRGADSENDVARIMTRAVATCAASDSLAGALTTMWSADVGFLPVVAQNRTVLGVITDRDAAVAACTRGKRMDEVPVEAVMNRDVASCREGDQISDALALMRRRRIRRLPVLDEQGKLAGVVTLSDAARAAQTDPPDLVATLTTIVQHTN